MARIASRFALILWLFTLILGMAVATSCGGGGGDDNGNPIVPVDPGIDDPDPDGGTPGPGPGPGGQPGPGDPGLTDQDTRSGTTSASGEVTLPGFSASPTNTKARRAIKYVVLDSGGRAIPGVFILNIRQAGEFLGAIVSPSGNRAPRLFFSDRIPDRLGTMEEPRSAATIDTNLFGDLSTSAMNIALEGNTLVVRITIPVDTALDASNAGTDTKHFLDNDLVNRLLSFGDLVSYSGVFARTELSEHVGVALQGTGGYVFEGALVQNGNLLSNWRLAPAVDTDPNDPTYRRFLDPILSDGSTSETFWIQQLAVTKDATRATIESRFNDIFLGNPLSGNLGPDQRYILIALDPLAGQTGFTGEVRKLLYIVPLFPRAVQITTADGDGKFDLNEFEAIQVVADYTADSTIALGPNPTAGGSHSTRVGLTANPIRPGDEITRPPSTPALKAVDELQRNTMAFYFIPDFFTNPTDYNQGFLGGDCENCLTSNLLTLVGPNGVVTNLPPSANVGIAPPFQTPPKLPADGLDVTISLAGTTDPDGEIIKVEVDWGDDSTPTVINGTVEAPVNVAALINHTYTEAGTHTISVEVFDSGQPQSSDTDTTSLTIIANVPPVLCVETIPANVDGVISGTPPLTVTFDATCSRDPDAPALPADGEHEAVPAGHLERSGTISADFGDGVRLTDQPFEVYKKLDRTYFAPNTYVVTITIKDADGASETTTFTVNVIADPPNELPTAEAGADVTTGEAPLTVHFTSDGSSDPDGTISQYIWNFNDSSVPGGGSSTQPNPTFVFANPGQYPVQLTVIDNEGGSDTDDVFIEAFVPANQSPTAVIDAPSVVELNQPVVFSSANSTDPDGSIVSFNWDFGDGNTSTEENPSHTYTNLPEEGFFIVTLQVTDDGAPGTGKGPKTGIAQHQLQVVEPFDATLPWAIITPTSATSGVAPLAVDLSGSDSYSPVGRPITAWDWVFSDTSETDTGEDVSHTFTTPGTYFVTLTVTDADAKTNSYSIPIFVSPSPPVPDALVVARATAAPVAQLPLTPIQFSSVGTYDPEGQAIDILGWDFDGNLSTLESTEDNPLWSFPNLGTFSVTLVASEQLPISDPTREVRASLLVRITTDIGPVNSKPVGIPAADAYVLNEPGTVNFTTLLAGDIEDPIEDLTFDWTFSDGGTDTGPDVSHAFADSGAQGAALSITDTSGGVTTHTLELQILPLGRPSGPMIDIRSTNTSLILDVGEQLDLDLTGTIDPEGENFTVLTDWGDGQPTSDGLLINHTYDTPGRYTVSISALDEAFTISARNFEVVVVDPG